MEINIIYLLFNQKKVIISSILKYWLYNILLKYILCNYNFSYV